ncbi:hypothetical protein [Burkholderia vietnamiensis]|jgi:hypothetical protein|uniref:hypothetical protein n=1 Tax=Burkholderia vietnamiensis TaxID=60552 RepID=UPI000A976E21|nr:hypothetical protein [Burkholderia vietnamiensis]MCA8016730.1 hypothetical protein [Burkholderia vietnamiensis]MCB4347897.1 hypothetical protein [Burkholderia vietnamiensis]MDN7413403.1 hypothetical protein [Burkholderia vietnamiensis]MDN8071336.1 hypothetical protein [Burkholderia vietnamiensis]UEB98769.1 hypothetical protein LK462_02950 [Burkholderia vietnamiensis]
MTGHVAEIAGHDPETAGHVRPKYAPIEIPRTPRTAPEQVRRKPLPDHLPREIQTHWPESRETCTVCGAPMKQLGEDVAEQLE